MTDKFIYINDAGIAKLVVRVSFLLVRLITLLKDRITSLMLIPDKLLRTIYAHERASGPGGNEKTGKYFYGQDFDALDVNVNAQGLRCMEATNATINLEHSRSGGKFASTR